MREHSKYTDTVQIGELRLVGPCTALDCRHSVSGNTIQIQGPEEWIDIPLNDVDSVILALRKLAER